MNTHTTFYGSGADVFWGEIQPCEHLVQIYDIENVFLDTLEGFVAGELCGAEGFSLLCAYPRVGFTQDLTSSITEICAAHSRVLQS